MAVFKYECTFSGEGGFIILLLLLMQKGAHIIWVNVGVFLLAFGFDLEINIMCFSVYVYHSIHNSVKVVTERLNIYVYSYTL